MKKYISILLAVAILFCSFSVTAFAGEAEQAATKALLSGFEVYDSDCDGVPATTADARETLEIALGIKAKSEGKEYDVDGNSCVDSKDALEILRASLGVKNILSDVSAADALSYLCTELDLVKIAYPGFFRTKTEQCTSMLITSSGWPNLFTGDFNVKDMEYVDYLKLTRDFYIKHNTGGSADQTIKDLDEAIEDAENMYEPVVNKRNVTAGSTVNHYNQFPVNTYKWACKLTTDDIKNVSISYANGVITITVNMNNYTYKSDEYPYKSNQRAARAELPYGKLFAKLPTFSSSSSSFAGLRLKDGTVTVKIDAATGMPTFADYYYAYELDAYSEEKANLGFLGTSTIKTTITQKASYAENYEIYALAK